MNAHAGDIVICPYVILLLDRQLKCFLFELKCERCDNLKRKSDRTAQQLRCLCHYLDKAGYDVSSVFSCFWRLIQIHTLFLWHHILFADCVHIAGFCRLWPRPAPEVCPWTSLRVFHPQTPVRFSPHLQTLTTTEWTFVCWFTHYKGQLFTWLFST